MPDSPTNEEVKEEEIKKDIEITPDKFILSWNYKDVDKKLTYDLKKCIGCSLCKLVCPVDAIELGPIPEIAQKILDESNPKLLIDHEKCCYCMLCAIVCPTDAFHENIEPEGYINLEEFPTLDKFFEIDSNKCIEDPKHDICQLCLKVRDRNSIKEYFTISKECPTQCFHIKSPIEGEVILRKNMLWKCDPQGCKACVNICPVESFFIPETAEDVMKYGKIACNEEACFYCGACENSCPDNLIVVNRKTIAIKDPKKQGDFPWVKGWIKNIKDILRKRLVENVKEPIDIPIIQQEIEKVKERILEDIPQLSDEEREKLNDLNEKVQSLLRTKKIRYWIKDGKSEKVASELKKSLKKDN